MNFVIGKNIEKIRETRGLTQKNLADTVGISKYTVKLYEDRKKVPRRSTLMKIADALNVPVDVLDGPLIKEDFEKTDAESGLFEIKDNIYVKQYDITIKNIVRNGQRFSYGLYRLYSVYREYVMSIPPEFRKEEHNIFIDIYYDLVEENKTKEKRHRFRSIYMFPAAEDA